MADVVSGNGVVSIVVVEYGVVNEIVVVIGVVSGNEDVYIVEAENGVVSVEVELLVGWTVMISSVVVVKSGREFLIMYGERCIQHIICMIKEKKK